MTPDVLKPSDLIARFGVSRQQFFKLQKRGAFRHLEIKRPIGTRRYSRALVEQFCSGESTARFGRGERS